jgi:DNA modification methylase
MKPYYETKNGVLYHGDCLEIMPQLEPVDLVLTDPPYGINYDGNTTIYGKGGKSNTFKNKTQRHKKAGWDKNIPSKAIFDLMFNVSKNQIIWGGNYFTDYLPSSRGWIYWDKKVSNPNNKTHSDGELAWTSYNKRLIKYTVDWIGFGRINSGEKNLHPTQKPLTLFIKILIDYSDKTNITLDPFLGSGTTAVACEELNRKWIGIEISEEYCEIAAKRIERETKQLKLF